MSSAIDLHTHTTISDGDLSPFELLAYAKVCGVKTLSITDHDTLDAYTEKLLEEADALGIRMIMGIELSTTDEQGKRYHITGYGSDLKQEPLISRLSLIRQNRLSAAEQMCECMIREGWNIDMEEVRKTPIVTKAHIGRGFLKHPDNQEKLLLEYNGQLPGVGRFIETWLIRGKPCFIPIEDALKPEEAISLLHECGGIAILAHPSEYALKGDRLENLIPRMIGYGIDGLEAVSIVFDRMHNDTLTEHRTLLTHLAKKHSLCVTGGSDFHTADTSRFGRVIDLGFRNHPWTMDEEDLQAFFELLSKLPA